MQYSTSDGSATAGQDYTATSGTLNWADGDFSVKSFTIAITDDPLNEANETVNVVLSNPGGGATLGNQSSAVVTIVDDDQAASLSINDVAQTEGNSGTTNFSFSVTLSPGSAQTVTVDYAAVSDTAILGTDFQPSSGTLTFGPGETQKSITVLVNGDTTQEPDRTFFVNLSKPNGGVTISKAQGTGTIINDDGVQPAKIQFDQSSYNAQEGLGALTIKVTRSGDTSGAATVDYATNDTFPGDCSQVTGVALAKCDYATTGGRLQFAAGETSKPIVVSIVDDGYVEGNETFTLSLSNPVGMSLGSPATTTITIVDNDQTASNPLDNNSFFVRQQYLDFLQREPERAGLQFYMDILNGCHPADPECSNYTRGALSGNFFRSPEFGRKGAYIANLFNVVIGQRPKIVAELADPTKVERPHYGEFLDDLFMLSTPNDDPLLTEQKKDQLASVWLGRAEVQAILPGSLSNQQFVQKLENIAGVSLANESTLIANLNNGSRTRAQVLRAVAESNEVITKFYIPNFVTMEYLGYLRRDPEDCHLSSDPENCGYIFHNNRFNTPGANPDLIENIIVRGFIESPEYRRRFGS